MLSKNIENAAFLLSLAAVSVLFAFMLKPFLGAFLWACVLALLSYPLQSYLAKRWKKRNLAAFATVMACIVVCVTPAIFLILAFLQEGLSLYQSLQSGRINPALWLDQINHAFPWLQNTLAQFHLDLNKINHQLSEKITLIFQTTAHYAMNIGQGALSFFVSLALALYLLFFMLRDGPELIQLLIKALPLGDERERLFMDKFAAVVRATVKGNLVVAIVQGSLGGLIFWLLDVPSPLLWGMVMIAVSLIPVVGAGLIWAPVAIYLFAIGDYLEASILTAFGVGIIGLVDNLLRPILVSKDTKMPDYLILLSTLGGISAFGINGFLLGPLIAVLFIAFWQIFVQDFNEPTF